ncbi:MAG TPA: type II CAAX endopeptidase family protein [Candidatus Angelobacter sp.]|nr:type II CAAX endopeptidase family protein [Candidatus Angelobacter sp.]
MHVPAVGPSNLADNREFAAPPPDQSPARTHRWVDLGLILLVAFGGSIVSSAYRLFHPLPDNYSNARFATGIFQELVALTLFAVLFSRQGRKVSSLGLSFQWTDIPMGLGLVTSSFVVMWTAESAIGSLWFITGHNAPHFRNTTGFTETSSWILLPFLLLNPVFEETLVRGYLMTELTELRRSVFVAALVSVAVQTSYHLYYGLFGALVVGCGLSVFAFFYATTRRLMPVIVAHMAWDLTALIRAWHR